MYNVDGQLTVFFWVILVSLCNVVLILDVDGCVCSRCTVNRLSLLLCTNCTYNRGLICFIKAYLFCFLNIELSNGPNIGV